VPAGNPYRTPLSVARHAPKPIAGVVQRHRLNAYAGKGSPMTAAEVWSEERRCAEWTTAPKNAALPFRDHVQGRIMGCRGSVAPQQSARTVQIRKPRFVRLPRIVRMDADVRGDPVAEDSRSLAVRQDQLRGFRWRRTSLFPLGRVYPMTISPGRRTPPPARLMISRLFAPATRGECGPTGARRRPNSTPNTSG